MLAKSHLAVLLSGLATFTVQAADTVLPTVTVDADAYPAGRADLAPQHPANPHRLSRSSQLAAQSFDRETIEALKPRDVFDLIDKATGSQIVFQGRKYPYPVRIRGEGNFAFLIDGAYFPPVTGSRILQNLPLSAIESMSVVRDASALALGPMIDIGASTTGALNNGFVVIRTRRASKDEFLARTTIEQHDTYAASGQAGWHFGDDADGGYLSALGARYQSAGKDDWYNARNANTVMGKAGYANRFITVDTLAYHDRGQFQFQRGKVGEATTGTNASPGVAYAKWSYSPLDTTVLSSDAVLSWSDRQKTLLSASFTRVTDTDRMDYYPVPPATKPKAGTEYANEDSTSYVALRHSAELGTGTLLQMGANYLHWNTPTGETNFEGYPREETVVGGFSLLEQAFADRSLILDASLRGDSKHIDTGWENIANSQGKAVSNTYHDRDLPTAWFLALGASWRPNADWLVNARYAHGKQGAASSLRSVGNKPLNGTNQDKIEIGAEAALTPAFTPSATWFAYSIRHDKYVAQTNTTVTPTLVFYDETDTRRQGIELVARGSLASGTRYRLGWTHFLKQYASTNSQLAATSPKNLFDASLQQTLGAYTATLSAKRVSTYLSNSFANDGLYHDVGGYTRIDLSVARSFRLGSGLLNASLYGRNLGNSHYESIYSFPDVGRVIGAEFNVEL